MTPPDGRRRRPALSCKLCRQRKIRCNRESPCNNCLRSRSDTCTYEKQKQPPPTVHAIDQNQTGRVLVPKTHGSHGIDRGPDAADTARTHGGRMSSSLTSGPSPISTPASQHTADTDIHGLNQRIKQLEERLSSSALSRPQSPHLTTHTNIESTSTRLGGTMHISFESSAPGQSQLIARNVFHKTRLLGQSHWGVNGVLMIRDIFSTIEPHLRADNSNAMSIMDKCKSLARVIKAGRAPTWPCLPTPDLPTKEVADALVDNYLRTSESIYRILHIPTFRRCYDTLWATGVPDTAFIVQLKLVLAIGAITYDETFSLRTSAMCWVYQAQTWVSEPKFKSRLDVPTLQTHLLLLIAQEGVGVKGDNMWISMGSLLRKAIFMGLHLDPTSLPAMSIYMREMRRRLWNTMLELGLQSSLTSGGPPLISLDGYTTAPPGNFDDDQLLVEQAVPRKEGDATQMSVSIALRSTFAQRLAVVKFLNDASSQGTYEETLRLDAQLRASYRLLRQTLQVSRGADTQSSSRLDVDMLDLLLHRYMLALHVPYFGPALEQVAYAYSRKVVVDSSLRLWRVICPDSSAMTAETGDVPANNWQGLSRLAICSSGFFPSIAMQAVFLIGLELRAQVQEDDGLGSTPLRPDLLSVMDEGLSWAFKAVHAGEVSIKGCLLVSLLASHIDALRKRLEPEAVAEMLMQGMEVVGGRCLTVLEGVVAKNGYGFTEGHGLEEALTTQSDNMEDWGFMMADNLFDGSDMGATWMFD